MSTSDLDLDIGNYTIKDLERFFQLSPNTKYTAAQIELKEVELREILLKSGTIDKKFKADLIQFLGQAKDWLTTVKCKKEPRTTLPPASKPVSFEEPNTRLQELLNREQTPYINTYNSEYFPDVMNPLKMRVISKYLNIDTRFRDNIGTTNSADFLINLPVKFKKVVSMQITAFEFPVAFYGISSKYGNSHFYISAKQQLTEDGEIFEEAKVVVIPDGNYNASDFINIINSYVSVRDADNTPINPESIFNYVRFRLDVAETGSGTAKVYLETTGALDYTIKSICLDFTRDINGIPDKVPVTTKIGMNLGFTKSIYDGKTSYLSETLIEPANIRYIYLAVDDFNNNVNNQYISAFNNSMMCPNILARISIKGSYFSLMMETELGNQFEPRKYFGPVDIQKLQFRIFDDHGRILDMNNSNFSCCILFKMLYDL
jgi:hypothetical protein